jgi:hypothetical protein
MKEIFQQRRLKNKLLYESNINDLMFIAKEVIDNPEYYNNLYKMRETIKNNYINLPAFNKKQRIRKIYYHPSFLPKNRKKCPICHNNYWISTTKHNKKKHHPKTMNKFNIKKYNKNLFKSESYINYWSERINFLENYIEKRSEHE